jgi:hypothetical protein
MFGWPTWLVLAVNSGMCLLLVAAASTLLWAPRARHKRSFWYHYDVRSLEPERPIDRHGFRTRDSQMTRGDQKRPPPEAGRTGP